MNKQVFCPTGRQLSRRTILRGACGAALSIPWLSAMNRAWAREPVGPPKRFVAMSLGLGLLGKNLNPSQTGRDYQPSLYLQPLTDLRDQLTIISGSSHPGVSGGHRAEASLLTANPVGSSGRAKNSISIDQLMAKHLGSSTRFPSLVLASRNNSSPSYTESGAMIPAENSPARLFTKLFVNDTKEAQAQQSQRAKHGRSIMDLVNDDARSLSRELGAADRNRLDAYLTSVRELEQRLAESEAWALRPKPKVDMPHPVDIGDPNDFIGRQRLMSGVIKLALQTDSTRFISFHIGGSGVLPIQGVEEGYHSLSHHGKDETKLEQLALVEGEIVRAWGDFLRDLSHCEDDGSNLLDNTSVLLTSNLGNGSNHSNKNMPVLVAGGGFGHAGHLAFDEEKNYPLPNLFVSLLQNVGLETDQFASSTGTLTGLSMS